MARRMLTQIKTAPIPRGRLNLTSATLYGVLRNYFFFFGAAFFAGAFFAAFFVAFFIE
jgi:hypothetical protein